MPSIDFEWDETKRLRPLSECGLDFRDARLLFDGRPLDSYPSLRFGEVVSIGLLKQR